MKKTIIKRKNLALAISTIYSSLVLMPVYASDTEIYTQSQATTIQPTLMMMFDTSGSMMDCMNNNDTAPNCGTGVTETRSRLAVLRSTMSKILNGDSATGVSPVAGHIKMGLAQYHPLSGELGGYILAPARPLDSFVTINPNGFITAKGSVANSDMTQDTKTPPVVSNALTGDLVIGADGLGNRAAGLNFSNVMIPKDAVITDAYIVLTAKTTQSGNSNWYIDAELSGDAADYTTTPLLAASRVYSAPVTSQPATWTAGQQTTISVTQAVQSVVSQSTWCGGNKLAIRIRDVGNSGGVPTTRTAYSFDSATSEALKPQLVVNYTIDPNLATSCIKGSSMIQSVAISNSKDDVRWTEGSTSAVTSTGTTFTLNNVNTSAKRLTAALRFNNIIVPQGRVLESAVLRMRSAHTGTMEPITVQGFKLANLPAFCGTSCSTASTISGYARTAATTWSFPSNAVTQYQKYELDVKAQVQEIINQSTWVANNNLGFILYKSNTSNTNNNAFYTFDSAASTAAVLDLKWSEPVVTNLAQLRTVREELVDEVNRLNAVTNTPLGQAYAETSRYLMSMRPYNTVAGQDFNSKTVNSLTASPPYYVTPIAADDNCSANYIFLLTDGDPTTDNKIKENTTQILKWPATMAQNSTTTPSPLACSSHWDCIKKLATFNVQAKADDIAKTPKKSIRTSTIILGPLGGTAETEMKNTATNGQGKFYKAGDEAALVAAISQTVKDLEDLSGSLASAGVAVNQLNRLTFLDQLYYAVFSPKTNSYRWDGNLKRYKLKADGTQIIDANGNPAVGTDGLFKADSKSFWTPTDMVSDGANATIGGAASVLPKPDKSTPTDTDYRRMFTFTGSLGSKNVPLTEINLTDATFNTSAMTAMGITDINLYKNVMNWYKGYDVNDLYNGLESTTGQRKVLGAALHSQPVVVNYGYVGDLASANNADNQINYVFYSTLEGTLHAVDTKTGKEKFSFIPSEKLATLKDQIDNPPTAEPAYGMDLTWVYSRIDKNGNGKVDLEDKVYLYGGMRMGGSNYYALDVTSLTSPKLLFAIQGGSAEYANLGQTWSQPVVANIKVQNKKRTVLVFGGGYDPKHENATLSLPFAGNDKGNSIYIVDATTGQLLWFASGNTSESSYTKNTQVSSMKFSVAASPTVIDKDSDTIADTIYFGDLGGQVHRVDLNPAGTDKNIAKRVKLVAKLGQTAVATSMHQRRFYEPVEVAAYKDSVGSFATVAIGSGYRSHPLNLVTEEHFYVLFDRDLFRTDLLTVSDSILQSTIAYDTSGTDLAQLDMNSTAVQSAGVNVSGKKGWYVKFPIAGEKTIGSPLVFNDRLIFGTYVPVLQGASNCSPVTGQSNQYMFCLPYGKLCAGSSTSSPYVKQNIMSGISGDPQVVIIPNPNPTSTSQYLPVLLQGTSADSSSLQSPIGQPVLRSNQQWREKVKKQNSTTSNQ